jgi:hypothetical protein
MEFIELLQTIAQSLIYDVLKMIVSFIIARYLYEAYIMQWLWGGWHVVVKKDKRIIAERNISPSTFKRIDSDETDFSTYIKGLVSPFEWLEIDPLSEEAKQTELIKRDVKNKLICIDLSKNPKKTAPITRQK